MSDGAVFSHKQEFLIQPTTLIYIDFRPATQPRGPTDGKSSLYQPIPACTQYLIEYSIYTSVVLDMFTTDPHTKSTPAVAGVSQGGAVPYGRATRRARVQRDTSCKMCSVHKRRF